MGSMGGPCPCKKEGMENWPLADHALYVWTHCIYQHDISQTTFKSIGGEIPPALRSEQPGIFCDSPTNFHKQMY